MELNGEYILSWLKIIIIDLTLAGDNALVIALAVHTLPEKQRRLGILFGAAGAVVIRIGLIFVASQLLTLPFLQLVGGIALVWIAFKLLLQESGGEGDVKQGTTLGEAIKIIIVADLIMSVDNVLAIAGAAHGDLTLAVLGVGLSIPIVVWGASIVSNLMNNYLWIIYLGAGVLGEVAAKMILEDHYVVGLIGEPHPAVEWSARIGLALFIVVAGMILKNRRHSAAAKTA